MERCHVCGNPTTEEKAYARIALSDRVYLICCPMCLTAIQAGAVQRRMVAKSHEAPRASVFVEYLPAGQVGGDYAWVHAVGRDLMYAVVADVSGHGITSSLVASRIAPEIERLARGRLPLAEFAEALNRLMWSTFSEERVYLTLVRRPPRLRGTRSAVRQLRPPAGAPVVGALPVVRPAPAGGLSGRPLRGEDLRNPTHEGDGLRDR